MGWIRSCMLVLHVHSCTDVAAGCVVKSRVCGQCGVGHSSACCTAGYKAAGDAALLQRCGRDHGLKVAVVDLLTSCQAAGQQVSSSQVRRAAMRAAQQRMQALQPPSMHVLARVAHLASTGCMTCTGPVLVHGWKLRWQSMHCIVLASCHGWKLAIGNQVNLNWRPVCSMDLTHALLPYCHCRSVHTCGRVR